MESVETQTAAIPETSRYQRRSRRPQKRFGFHEICVVFLELDCIYNEHDEFFYFFWSQIKARGIEPNRTIHLCIQSEPKQFSRQMYIVLCFKPLQLSPLKFNKFKTLEYISSYILCFQCILFF